MNDREIMEDLLNVTKGVCDLYMHGTIESATPNIKDTFNSALDDTLAMQGDIYNQMKNRGWYEAQQAQAQQIRQVKQKFCCC